MMDPASSVRIHITGIIQGVGFRPFIYTLAMQHQVLGWVKNTSAGVDIVAEGQSAALESFIQDISQKKPPLARIDSIRVSHQPVTGYLEFSIIQSEPIPNAFQPISPDVSICPDCLSEMQDTRNRRYSYPFINCTNCGPRFTIIQDIPYDRPNTTMSVFPLCPECAREYSEPLDRRFHAQPVACHVCGPHIWVEDKEGVRMETPDPIQQARELLLQGKILAIKGLGGFHLACDGTNETAVAELRRRKLRIDKPFALMAPDVETIRKYCMVSPGEVSALDSIAHPIILLEKAPGASVASQVAPGQNALGMMLPYTPLHHLLFSQNGRGDGEYPCLLVMTSGNLSEEPIATDNDEARQRLASLADYFLMHNRPIHMRCDDSVARIQQVNGKEFFSPIRRSRGYVPTPINLGWESPAVLATGGELKNTFCLLRDQYAFVSHHIGDLENYETLKSFEDGIAHFERLFRIQPQIIAHDLHPNYLASRYAVNRGDQHDLPLYAVQHHHAHIGSCMAENHLDGSQPVIGVAFDGTGYGIDGAIWGGELLLADYTSFHRVSHLEYFPLPGGDASTRRPARAALAYLWFAGIEWANDLPCVSHFTPQDLTILEGQLAHKLNTPLTSSMGRLFDIISSLVGIRQAVNYEAQAAIELEAIADPTEIGSYSYELGDTTFSVQSLVREVLFDLRAGISPSIISARFHNSLANLVLELSLRERARSSSSQVILSGGVWQNRALFTRTTHLLTRNGFDVFFHQQVPTNDGGLSLGQAVIASYCFSKNLKEVLCA